MEEWRDIPRQEGRYQASSLGRIRSVDRVTVFTNGRTRRFPSRVLVPKTKKCGHLEITMCHGNYTQTSHLVHRLVYESFLGPIEDGFEVHHKDHDPANNAISNLELLSSDEHYKLHIPDRTAAAPKGESNHASKLTSSDVVEIYRMCHLSSETTARIGSMYGISPQQVSKIGLGQRWAHLTKEVQL